MEEIRIVPLQENDLRQFVLDNQEAFRYGAMEEFGVRDEHYEDGDQIISEKTILRSVEEGDAYRICLGEEKVGGVIVSTEGDHGHLDILFVSPSFHSKGIGYQAWCEIEKMYPQVRVWETVTPYFDKRNIHFYINRCGFHAVEFYNSHHRDPDDPDAGSDDLMSDGMFRFIKIIDKV
ncbi:MAG: GNAT family N-acetyltransferase [Erysipelotrichaceae bacterium]|nr:GNAT family N-acetyltransferase [Erysipelotrichaceae bacterium]